MSRRPRRIANRIVRILAATFGSKLRDEETGEVLGKAFLLPWRGKVHVIGYGHQKPLIARFSNRGRASYWKQEIGFTTHDTPDFPRVGDEGSG